MNNQIGVGESKYEVTNDPLFIGREGIALPTFRIFGTPSISRKIQIWHADGSRGVPRSKGVVKGLRGLLLEFWDPLHIWWRVQARNFKFGPQIDHDDDDDDDDDVRWFHVLLKAD